MRCLLAGLRPSLRYSHAVLAWPLLCALAALLLWASVQQRLKSEHEAAVAAGWHKAQLLAGVFAAQSAHTVRNLDHTVLNLRHQWQRQPGDLDYADQLQGSYPPLTTSMQASVFDRNGELVGSTLDSVQRVNVSDRDDFQSCMRGDAVALRISGPLPAAFNGRQAICFSRPVLDSRGGFDGMLSVCTAPLYLISFHHPAGLDRADFYALARPDGSLLASAHGSTGAALYRAAPVLRGDSGVTRLPASQFSDAVARVVAWQTLAHYGLVASVGISEPALLAGYRKMAREHLLAAAAASMLLLLLALTGMIFSARLAWRKQLAADIRSTYLMAMDGGKEGFLMVRALHDPHTRAPDFITEDCNERGADYAGVARAALLGRRFSEFEGNDWIAGLGAACREAMAAGFHEEELEAGAIGAGHRIWLHRRFVRSGPGLAVTIRDISDAKAHQETLSRMAYVDALTGLPNRSWLMEFLPRAIEAAAGSGSMLALLFIDLDDFKSVNDSCGHDAGDALLQAAAGRLASAIRMGDTLARLGGDEFIIVLERVEHAEVVHVAERAIAAMAQAFMLGSAGCRHVHASVGISLYPQDGATLAVLLRHADLAMYLAKSGGKGRYAFHAAAGRADQPPAALPVLRG